MFQSFNSRTRPEDGVPRLASLRDELRAEGLSGYLVPRADAHQGEYVAPHDDRMSWLTGFTGSAGFCAALLERAGIFIDGRYRVQVKTQVDTTHFTPVPWPEIQLGGWLRDALPEGGVIGYAPWLHAWQEMQTLEAALAGSGITLRAVDNLIDRIWADQPAPPTGKVAAHPIEFAGISSDSKRADLADSLRDMGCASTVITLPDSIAWLLNIRGSDIAHNPVPHAFLVLHDTGKADLFIADAKLTPEVTDHLGPDITLHAPDAFEAHLKSLPSRVLLDKLTAPMQIVTTLQNAGVDIHFDRDPCVLPKARKNPVEIDGMAEAHLRDGAAMVEFLCWLDQAAPLGNETEISVVKQLEHIRRATNALHDISFETISAAGPHAALPHYRVDENSNLPVETGKMLLVDSGGQYKDGTTDITRTIAVGDVPDEEKACFTRVLQGMIAMSRLRWPEGLAGRDVDAVARYPLWLAGMDYNHGTGHGVGAFLSVHEGPVRLSKVSELPLEAGMILSNEPGYYREGAFGIRIENLLAVEGADANPGADGRAMLSFRTITFTPIDTRLVLVDELSRGERDWLNAYHAETLRLIAPRVSGDTLEWLQKACAAI